MLHWLSRISFFRYIVIALVRATAFDTSVKNPWTGQRLFLNTYRHKGYWYFGRTREAATMNKFKSLISEGSTVIEVGGHIGFITQYFAKLVGASGRVIVFEPGTNNLRYIEKNTHELANVFLERKAVSNVAGRASFYEDSTTGQNNSLLSDYKGVDSTAKSHNEKPSRVVTEVETIRLDDYLDAKGIKPDFIKIDIEGYEFQALLGSVHTLKTIKALMVEISENHRAVSDILTENGLSLYDEQGHQFQIIPDEFHGNIFAIRV